MNKLHQLNIILLDDKDALDAPSTTAVAKQTGLKNSELASAMAPVAKPSIPRQRLRFDIAGKMAATPKATEIEHPQFFILQSERLSALLDAVVAESSTATSPDACIDYLEITDILVELLEQSQYFSVLTWQQIQARWQDVESLISKILTIEGAIADWETRTKSVSDTASVDSLPTANGSRKRTRSVDSEIELLEAAKRRRESEYTLVGDMDLEFDVGLGSISLSIERAPAAWWNEPFYD